MASTFSRSGSDKENGDGLSKLRIKLFDFIVRTGYGYFLRTTDASVSVWK